MEELVNFINEAHMFFLATTEGNQPRVRPFGQLMLLDGNVYFNTSNTKKVYNQLLENPKVELCSFNNGVWIRIKAEAMLKTSEHLKNEMFKRQPGVAKMYKDKSETFEIFMLQNIEARKYSVSGEEIIKIN